MFRNHQCDGDRMRGYNGPVSQADEIDVEIPILAADTPVQVAYDIPQHIPVGAVAVANLVNPLLAPKTHMVSVQNSTAGKLTIIWLNVAGTAAPVATRLRYKLDSHSIPTSPQTPIGV